MVLVADHRDGMGPTETIDRRETITENGIEDITARVTSNMTFPDHDKDLSLTLNIIIATAGEKDPVPQRDGTETFGDGSGLDHMHRYRYRDEMAGAH
jgi:hypothetical protein